MQVFDDGSKSAGYLRGYLARQEEVDALTARIRALEAGLAKYGRHKPGCPARAYPTCACGFAALAGES